MAEKHSPAAHSPGRGGRRVRWTIWIVAIIACAVIVLLRFGGYLLVKTNPLPSHAEVAVVLNGNEFDLRSRTAEGVRLLKSAAVDDLMLSVPPTTYWGQSVPAVAHQYFVEHFGQAIADRIAYCISDATSTIQEAQALRQCLESRGWRRVIVVTTNYHSRRAGRIWRAALAKASPPFEMWVDGVANGVFQPRGWWRQRTYAKTWVLETCKLLWESVFGLGPWKSAPTEGTVAGPGGK